MENLQTTTPAAVFASMNLRYLGLQATGRGKPDAYLFDHSDNSTLMMDGPVTVESVLEKIAEHDEIVRKFNAALTDQQMVQAIKAAEGEIKW